MYPVGPSLLQRVREATFAPARFGRRGLDERDVSGFCKWIAGEISAMLNERAGLEEELRRLRERLIRPGNSGAGVQPEDAHVQAVYVLSKAQQTADQYVADAQEYSRELAEDAQLRRDEILREAKVRASMILEQAHESGREAANRVPAPPAGEGTAGDRATRHDLEAEIAYLRTFSDVCRTHLRAYLDSLSASIEQWERAERAGALTAREQARQVTGPQSPPQGFAVQPARGGHSQDPSS
jgi:cell division septum initiation protein DivIVA